MKGVEIAFVPPLPLAETVLESGSGERSESVEAGN